MSIHTCCRLLQAPSQEAEGEEPEPTQKCGGQDHEAVQHHLPQPHSGQQQPEQSPGHHRGESAGLWVSGAATGQICRGDVEKQTSIRAWVGVVVVVAGRVECGLVLRFDAMSPFLYKND